MYSAALGVMCEERAERSPRKEDEAEGMESPGTMVSFWMVARRPRWEVEVMRLPRAVLSSCEAVGGLACCCYSWRAGLSVPAIPDCMMAAEPLWMLSKTVGPT